MIFTIFELAIILILPLAIILSKYENKRTYLIFIFIVYIIWYLTYSLTHELSHFVIAKILNERVIHYQLIPKFWKGQVSGGYLKILYTSNTKEFLIVLAPYFRDLICALIGFILIRRRKESIYFTSSVLLFCVSSSLFDILNNYIAYLLGALNDYNALGYTTYKNVPHLIGIVSVTMILYLFYLSFRTINDNIILSRSEN